MMLDSGRASAAPNSPHSAQVEFYTIELARLADGTLYLSMAATVVDNTDEPELTNLHIADQRVATIDDALAMVKECVQLS
jgi:hypothetical protein